ncbi:hypothetical protein [Streptomyces sp. NBC_00503]|uniref:hypothetical protein n=1 Tax=Streptomyces sp. NBC_00503 TaxID=2903659 RepID=UPI002E805C01|nr:hypothetical protein [Streptomyces sp. NBC_00503]WUD79367.1 YwqG family protein [Streptomyces sp. NBC_00503]
MTTTLMTYAGPGEPDALVTRTGGNPLAPAGTAWPRCATCDGPMQFLAQIVLDEQGRPVTGGDIRADRVMAVFMCQNDPGMCEEWSPTEGGNRALLFPAGALRPMPVPAPEPPEDEDAFVLGAVNSVALVVMPAADYRGARQEWADLGGNNPREVLGQLGGTPDWLQGDETPPCPACARPMDLVAQLEEGPAPATAMNFGGGGSAFAFACAACARAAFLWQC